MKSPTYKNVCRMEKKILKIILDDVIVTKCYKWKINITFGSGRFLSDTKPKQLTIIKN